MEFSRCARDQLALREKAGQGPVSQNSTAFDVEVDVDLGEPASWTTYGLWFQSRNFDTATGHRQDRQPPE
jgi:hypothetical protein